MLGVSYASVPLMIHSGRRSLQDPANGRRYIRRHLLEVIANAREIRLIEEAVSEPRIASAGTPGNSPTTSA